MDIRKIKKLIELLEESGIAEIEIKEGEEAVRISRMPVGAAVTHMIPQVQVGAAAVAPAIAPGPVAAEPVARLIEVAGQLGLAVDHHRIAAGIFVEVDVVEHAVMGNVKAVVDFTLAVHAVAACRLAHQLGKAAFEHAGADARQHMVAAVFLQHDGFDTLEMQKL